MRATIIKEPLAVHNRLQELELQKDELLGVARRAVTGRFDAVENDPANAAGWLAYQRGTRRLREICRANGWELDRAGGVESVVEPRTGTKLVYQNADAPAATEARAPQPVSPKGEASRALVNQANGNLWTGFAQPGRAPDGSMWYLLVHVGNQGITVELSAPRAVQGGRFDGYIERIFLLNPGDDDSSLLLEEPEHLDDLDEEDDVEITVSRK